MRPGKGLEALIPKRDNDPARVAAGMPSQQKEGVFMVEISEIEASGEQSRKHFVKEAIEQLAQSIKNYGVLQPLIVEKFEEETPVGVSVSYHLLAGERRLRAAKLVGLKQIPVVVRRASDDRTRLLLSLIENIQREDLNAVERAEAYQRLQIEYKLSQEEIAERVGKSRESVANTLRLLKLSDTVKDTIRRGELSEGHGRALLAAPEDAREELFTKLRVQTVSVRDAEAMARQLAQADRVPIRRADPKRAEDEAKLQETLGVSVRITNRGKRGSISLGFSSREEFRALLMRLLGGERS